MFDVGMIKFGIYFKFYKHYISFYIVEHCAWWRIFQYTVYDIHYKTMQYRREIFLNVRYGLKEDIEVEI